MYVSNNERTKSNLCSTLLAIVVWVVGKTLKDRPKLGG